MMEVRAFSRHTYAKSTTATYRSHLMAYLRYCVRFNFNPVPATQECILGYIAFLARSLKPTLIQNYLNIIRIVHLDAGLANPLENNFAATNLKKGISRELGSPPKQMLPMTLEMMHAIFKSLCFLIPEDIAFWSICTIGFFGFLRKSTLLPVSVTNPGDGHILYSDVVWERNDSFVINVRKTKTIQEGQRILKLPFVGCQSNPLCPVKALLNLLCVSPLATDLSLFAYQDRMGIHFFTHHTFVDKLREILKNAGFEYKSISGHSFRRGGASLAFALGMTMFEIKERGDWVSDAVKEYVYVSDEQSKHIARSLVNGSACMFVT